MKKLCLNFLVLFSFITAYAQEKQNKIEVITEEDEIIDSLFSDEIIEDLFKLSENLNFLHFSINYNNNTYFSGRDIGIDQLSITPQINYIHSKGYFAGLSGVYYKELDPKWDYTSITVGYGKRFGKTKMFRWSVYYDRYFFSEPSNNPLKNSINLSLEIDNKSRTLGTELATSFLFGTEKSGQIVSSSYGEISLLKIKKSELNLRPTLRFIVAQQTIQLAQTFTFRNRTFTIYRQNNEFGLLNAQLLLPLQYSYSGFDFEAGYILNFPSALEGESNLKTTGTFMFSIAYLLGL
ncbi:hypothetical protein [Tenacibaculum sp. nBUS_03]|uniref:hypothetical protein n=1 Tax=Tenacibaculum sp. nBUS_03 TaxID=3395320 RepID=UPI003EBD4E9C